MADDLYDTDFYTWTQRQADHLRAGRFHLADLTNIVEEIESLGRSEASALKSAYRLIAMDLLKLMLQPDKATNSWRATIVRERGNVRDMLGESPGLKPQRPTLFTQAYAAARREAEAETGLPRSAFPAAPPFTLDQVEDEDFWPDPTV